MVILTIRTMMLINRGNGHNRGNFPDLFKVSRGWRWGEDIEIFFQFFSISLFFSLSLSL